jgi:hypothetical protein
VSFYNSGKRSLLLGPDFSGVIRLIGFCDECFTFSISFSVRFVRAGHMVLGKRAQCRNIFRIRGNHVIGQLSLMLALITFREREICDKWFSSGKSLASV